MGPKRKGGETARCVGFTGVASRKGSETDGFRRFRPLASRRRPWIEVRGKSVTMSRVSRIRTSVASVEAGLSLHACDKSSALNRSCGDRYPRAPACAVAPSSHPSSAGARRSPGQRGAVLRAPHGWRPAQQGRASSADARPQTESSAFVRLSLGPTVTRAFEGPR